MFAQAPGATFYLSDAYRAPGLTLLVLAYFCPIDLVAIVFDAFLNCTLSTTGTTLRFVRRRAGAIVGNALVSTTWCTGECKFTIKTCACGECGCSGDGGGFRGGGFNPWGDLGRRLPFVPKLLLACNTGFGATGNFGACACGECGCSGGGGGFRVGGLIPWGDLGRRLPFVPMLVLECNTGCGATGNIGACACAKCGSRGDGGGFRGGFFNHWGRTLPFAQHPTCDTGCDANGSFGGMRGGRTRAGSGGWACGQSDVPSNNRTTRLRLLSNLVGF